MSTFACRVIINGKEDNVYEAVDVNGGEQTEKPGKRKNYAETRANNSKYGPGQKTSTDATRPLTQEASAGPITTSMEDHLSYLKAAEEAREKWQKDCFLELEERRLAAESPVQEYLHNHFYPGRKGTPAFICKPGAKIEDVHSLLKFVLETTTSIVLHVGTNDLYQIPA
ncbi:hypothetical protein HPB50_003636 [Hyalomma asiaticum]|uniref:Uncharacterized protein n=1 Tax=Hyalomma asiaticum TaxID=266040 RepID=A0ACB7SGB1_HYAAI|nr:hypothetical protein HPB50_003636 [Hyalomma asiaticum]